MTRYYVVYTGYPSNLVGPSPASFQGSCDITWVGPISSAEDVEDIAETIRAREKLARVVVTGWTKYEE